MIYFFFLQFKCKQEKQSRQEVSLIVQAPLCFCFRIFSSSLVFNGCRPDNISKWEKQMSLFHAQCKSLEEIEEMTDNRCQIEEWREKNGLYQQRLSLKSKNSREKTANDCRTTTSSISGWNTEIYCLKDVTMLTIFRFQKQIFQSQETKPILAHVRETQIFYLLHEHWADDNGRNLLPRTGDSETPRK